jgi:hypothetical protein
MRFLITVKSYSSMPDELIIVEAASAEDAIAIWKTANHGYVPPAHTVSINWISREIPAVRELKTGDQTV